MGVFKLCSEEAWVTPEAPWEIQRVGCGQWEEWEKCSRYVEGRDPRSRSCPQEEGGLQAHSQGQAPQPSCLGSNALAAHDVSTLDMAPRPCHGPGNVLIPLHACVAGTNLTQSIIQVGKK